MKELLGEPATGSYFLMLPELVKLVCKNNVDWHPMRSEFSCLEPMMLSFLLCLPENTTSSKTNTIIKKNKKKLLEQITKTFDVLASLVSNQKESL